MQGRASHINIVIGATTHEGSQGIFSPSLNSHRR